MQTPTAKGPFRVAFFVILAVSTLLACFALFASSQVAAVPSTMNFQGRLADASGNTVANGLYNMQFKLYTASSGGSPVWSETRETTSRVQVTNGLFSTKLGEVSAIPASLFASGNLYFEITLATPGTATCNTASCASWESPMTPRHQLSTSAYAFNSDTLDGLDSTAFAAASGSANYIQNGTSPQTADFNITGTGTAATLQASTFDRASSGTLTIGGTNATSIALADSAVLAANMSLTLTGGNTASRPGTTAEGMMYYDTSTKQLLVYANSKWQADRSDAVLVAASNSSDADKASADYIADGNTGTANDGDQIQINQALTAASGKKVVLLAGTYVADATILVPNNTILSGVGNGTVLELADLDASENLIENSDVTTGTGIVIRDMKLDGRNDLNTAGTQTGIALENMGDAATSKVGATVSEIHMTRFRSDALYIDSSDNNTLTNNSVLAGGSGIAVYNGSSYNTVSGNTVSGVIGDVFGLYGSHNTISNNIASGNTFGTGFYIGGTFFTVSGNISRSNGGHGFEIQGSDHTISGNTASSNTSSGFSIAFNNRTNATGNTASSNSDSGISVYASTQINVSNNAVVGNTTHGIQTGGSSGSESTGVLVSDNIIHNNGGSGANHSIYLESYTVDAKVTGNKISDTAGTGNAIRLGAATVTGTYLSGNVFSGTGATTISDSGTGTVYANQSKTAGGIDVLYKQVASANAFEIQNASGVSQLTADTTNSRIIVGSTTTDATAILFALDNYNQASDPTGVNGAMYYNTNLNKFRCYQNSAWADCISSASAGANTSLSNLSGVNINAALNATGANLTLQTTTSGNIVLNAAGTTELQDDTNVGGNLTIAATKSLTLTGGTTAQRPGSPTEGMLFYDTDTDRLLVYAGGKWQADRSTATKIVATSASGGTSSAVASQNFDGADFVNTSDSSAQTVIASAISALPASGGAVYLMEGTYIVDGSISIPSNVTISGSGAGTILKIKNGTNATMTILSATSATTGVKVRNLTLEGNKANNSSGTQNGLDAPSSGSDGILIDSVTAQNFRTYGIYLSGSEEAIVQNSTTKSNTVTGIFLQNSDYSTISNNVSASNGTYNFHIDGAYITMTGNVARSSTSGAGFYSTSANATVTSNTSYGNATYGFWMAAQYATVSNNSASNNTSAGFYIAQSNQVVSGNTATANTGAGILLLSVNNNQIIGNRLTSNGSTGSTSSLSFQPSGGANNNSFVDNYITDTAGTGYAILISSSNATNTYVSGNIFSGTGATAISDSGSGTIYVNQATTAGGLDLLTRQAASASAFQVQNASSVALLTADSSNNRIQIGSSTTDATGIVFALDNYNQAGDPTGVNGGMYYNTNTSKFRCYQSGAWADCITAGGANAALSNLSGVAINQSLIAGTNNSIDIGSSGTQWRSGYFGTALYAPAIRPLADSSTALLIQNAAGSTSILTIDSSANTVLVGSTTNGVTIGSNGITLAGTARPDITVTLNPEYTGATFTGDGTNNNGSLSSDYCSGSSRQNINAANCGATETHNYYAWTTTQATAQDYDIYVRYQLPSDYASGSLVNMKIFGWGTTAANESLTVALQVDSAAGDCSTSSDVVTSNTTWQSATVASPLGSCTPAAGDVVTFKVKVTAGQNNTVRAGAISFGYKKAF